jgi:kynurenine formamidase
MPAAPRIIDISLAIGIQAPAWPGDPAPAVAAATHTLPPRRAHPSC